ncbi:unnamed protein product [Prorocentrum cordatum]|uniref:Phytanoyl-CoA dioxygenase n=1 Tax=Prorocentrum cordatum TaxID=2364126 RepID=A0ABN9Q1M6_9DINO|nr:unnamed protein product [Polarella glacialis]
MQAIADTMASLQERGVPPVFVFMYGEVWALWRSLFAAAAELLGVSEEELRLDASVFAWALRPAGAAGEVGSNFGRPHRDDSYSDCHTADGRLSILSMWLPVVPVTTSNGCMYVVPAQHDPLFAEPSHPLHMRPEEQMPWAHIRPLPASPGDVLMWKGNLIHWGSAPDGAGDPRKSIASAFFRAGSAAGQGISLGRLRAGLSVSARLQLVLRALLVYSDWHPGFAGLERVLQGPGFEKARWCCGPWSCGARPGCRRCRRTSRPSTPSPCSRRGSW